MQFGFQHTDLITARLVEHGPLTVRLTHFCWTVLGMLWGWEVCEEVFIGEVVLDLKNSDSGGVRGELGLCLCFTKHWIQFIYLQ